MNNVLTTNKQRNNVLDLTASNKDMGWYNTVLEAYLPKRSKYYLNEFERRKRYYEVLNGDLSSFKEDIQRMCSHLIDFGISDENLLYYNKLQNKLNILIVDMLSMSSTENIILLHVKAIQDKDEELKQAILQNVETELSSFLNQNEAQLRTATPEQIQKLVDDYKAKNIPQDFNRKTFLSEVEIYKHNMLKYIKLNDDITSKKITTLKTALVESKFAVLSTWVNGRPTAEVLNTLFCVFDTSPNQPFFEKGDYFGIFDEITTGDCIQEYGNELTPEELKETLQFTSYYNSLGKEDLNSIKFDQVMFNLLDRVDIGKQSNYN